METDTRTEAEMLGEIQERIAWVQANATDHPKEQRLSFAKTLERVRSAPVSTEERLAALAKRQRAAEHADQRAKFISAAGARLAACRLSNFSTASDYQRTVIASLSEWVASWPQRRANGDGIVLYGPVGTGKDHLAFGAAYEVLKRNQDVTARWINGRELFGVLRDRISEDASEAAYVRQLSTPTLLVISDPLPPIGDLTPFQADMLYRVSESRYAAKAVTIVTLNVASDEEADRRLGAATWDRMCHGAWKIACQWPSYRVPARELRP